MKMSRSLRLLPVLALAWLTGCSSPDSRIKANRAAFDALPAETQAKIREGKIEVGYTPELVIMALGKPDRSYTRTSAAGQSEVWAYRDKGPGFSFGVGVGGYGSGVGGGVGVSTAGDRDEDKMRVIFEAGKVAAIESAAKAKN